ncbi:MAG: hypothetical protein U9N49_11770 [Campylobacterota bacterium]|nr:hypothetical protein [Campylobacterota bacterium]
MSRKGFVTIEILVAMVIGFLAIIMLTSSIKSLQRIIGQQKLYEDLYITVLSLKDTIEAQKCYKEPNLQGELNGFKYTIECNEKKALKNYRGYYDEMLDQEVGGNHGILMIYLFDVTIYISKEGLKKSYSFYQSEQERLISEEELLNEMLQSM